MKHRKKTIGAYVIFVIIMASTVNASDTVSPSNAVQILETLRATKTLTLASGPNFYVKDPHRNPATVRPGSIPFVGISIHAPHMIRKFGFHARLTRPDRSTIEMEIASRTNAAVVVVKTADGQPYALLANTQFVMCDPNNPGGLAYFENGSTLWGFYQMPGDSMGSMDFRMNFVPTNVLSAAYLDVDNILRNMLIKTTNATTKASFNADSQTVNVETENSITKVVLTKGNALSPFGIQKLSLKGHDGTGLEFSNFTIGRIPMKGLFHLTKHDIEKLGLPMRTLTEADFSMIDVLPPRGTTPPARQKAASKLKELIASLQKTSTTTATKKEKASNP